MRLWTFQSDARLEQIDKISEHAALTEYSDWNIVLAVLSYGDSEPRRTGAESYLNQTLSLGFRVLPSRIDCGRRCDADGICLSHGRRLA